MPFESEEFRKEFDKHILSRRVEGGGDGTTLPPGLSRQEVSDFLFNLRRQARIKLGLDEED